VNRHKNIDLLKALALISVFLIHLKPLRAIAEYEWLSFILINTSRFAVPVFFLISGFLLQVKLREKPDYALKYLHRIVDLSVKGVLTLLSLNIGYIILVNSADISVNSILGNLALYHLWFLPVLVLSIALVYTCYAKDQLKLLLYAAVSLHFAAILLETYMALELPFTGFSKLSAGLLYTCIGFLLASIDFEELSSKKLGFVLILAAVLHLLERYFIKIYFSAPDSFYYVDYSFLTVPMSIAVFLSALSLRDLSGFERLSIYGRNTFWGYIIHPLFLVVFLDILSIINSVTVFPVRESLFLGLLWTPILYIAVMEAVVRLQKSI
jgi:surface polysaccharide O-acyltransferase-like enzyme